MATPEQLTAALQEALRKIDDLTSTVQQQQTQFQQETLELKNARAAISSNPGAGSSAPGIRIDGNFTVDTRVLGRPESFDGTTGWRDWSIVFRR